MASTITFDHGDWPPQLGSNGTIEPNFVMVQFDRGNSQRKAGSTLPRKETLIWNGIVDATFLEHLAFFSERAQDGKAFWYKVPNDTVQRQWIVQNDGTIAHQAISNNASTLTVSLLEVFDV